LQEEISVREAQIRAGLGGDDTALEKGLMRLLRGRPHVIQLLETWHDSRNVHTVMEYLQEDLIGLLNRVGVLKEDTVQRVFAHTCIGLKVLHDAGYCHRDLSPENVLVTTDAASQPLAKVIDFGAAGPLRDADGAERALPGMEVPFGKLSYLSPEYYGKKAYDGRRNDLWALGCTLFVLSERKMLFDAPSVADFRFRLLSEGRHKELFDRSRRTDHAWNVLPESAARPVMSEALTDVLAALLQVDPERRPASVDSVLAHPWVRPHAERAMAEWAKSVDGPISPSAAAGEPSSSSSSSSG
jgi:eukaryotic-like serine/threonine-protein kinase